MLTQAIYGLVNPNDKYQIRYIGQTSFLSGRLNMHIQDALVHRGKHNPIPYPSSLYHKLTNKQRWIAELLHCGIKPEIKPLVYVDESDANKEERIHQALWYQAGHALMNSDTDKPPDEWLPFNYLQLLCCLNENKRPNQICPYFYELAEYHKHPLIDAYFDFVSN